MAGDRVTRPPTADSTTPAPIGPSRRLDADDPVAVADAARSRACAGRRRRRAATATDGERPRDAVVAGGRALDVVRAAEDRIAAAAGQIELRGRAP